MKESNLVFFIWVANNSMTLLLVKGLFPVNKASKLIFNKGKDHKWEFNWEYNEFESTKFHSN